MSEGGGSRLGFAQRWGWILAPLATSIACATTTLMSVLVASVVYPEFRAWLSGVVGRAGLVLVVFTGVALSGAVGLVVWRLRELLGKTFVLLLYAISPQGFDWLLRTMSGIERASQGQQELGIRDWEGILPRLNNEALEMVAIVVATYDPLSEDQWIKVKEGTRVATLRSGGSIVVQRRKMTVACEELVASGLISEWQWGSDGLPSVRLHAGFGPGIFVTVKDLIGRELKRRDPGYEWTYDWAAE